MKSLRVLGIVVGLCAGCTRVVSFDGPHAKGIEGPFDRFVNADDAADTTDAVAYGAMDAADGSPADAHPDAATDAVEDVRGDGASDANEEAEAPATWGEIYALFDATCRGCHNPGGSGNLHMTSQALAYAHLVNVDDVCWGSELKRVKPGDASSSALYVKLTADVGCGRRMPLGGPFLPEEAIARVESWINAGALNN